MTYQQYATVEDTLRTIGGKGVRPGFGKFGGKVAYPNLSPSASVMVITSTTNYENMPSLGSGTPIVYIQLATTGGTTFGTQISSGGGLVGAKDRAVEDVHSIRSGGRGRNQGRSESLLRGRHAKYLW